MIWLLGAVQVALHEVIGAYAIAILDQKASQNKSSPHARAVRWWWASGATMSFIWPRMPPLLWNTLTRWCTWKTGDIAVIRPGDAEAEGGGYGQHAHAPYGENGGHQSWPTGKGGGYPYFMLKEIFEQPDCLLDCMRGRINIDADNVTLSAVIDHKDKLLSASRFIIVACGTSWHAGLIGQQLIENYCRIPVYVEYASDSATVIPSFCLPT